MKEENESIYGIIIKKISNMDKSGYQCAVFSFRNPNNDKLLDEEFIYNNVEVLFVEGKHYFYMYQGFEQYYAFFKAITKKYDIESDYQKYLEDQDSKFFQKWSVFAQNLISFMTSASDSDLKMLFAQEDFVNYFLRYPEIFDKRMFLNFDSSALSLFLNVPRFKNYYIDNPLEFLEFLKINENVKIPENMFEYASFKRIAYDINVENFYYNMSIIQKESTGLAIIEEHKSFCRKELEGIKEGILPSLQDEYQKADEVIEELSLFGNDYLKSQVMKRIFERYKCKRLPKETFYQELSKYIAVGLIMSYFFETSPFNLFKDINNMYEYARKTDSKLKGYKIYDFLINFESKSIGELQAFYEMCKNNSIKEILYDDYLNQKYQMINSINASLIDFNSLTPTDIIDGVKIYDITENPNYILGHLANVSVKNTWRVKKLLERIKKGDIPNISLSLQDNKTFSFIDVGISDSVKFAYGKLDPSKVGIVYHQDAYSVDINESDGLAEYVRSLYTPEELMKETIEYNEIVYLVSNNPVFPIALVCEEEINEEEKNIARELNIPILFRKSKCPKQEYSNLANGRKRYIENPRGMNLF